MLSKDARNYVGELLWIIKFRDDVEADFLRFYGIFSPDDLDTPKYLKLALRLPHYQGAVTNQLLKWKEEQTSSKQATPVNLRNMGGETTKVEAQNSYLRKKLKKAD